MPAGMVAWGEHSCVCVCVCVCICDGRGLCGLPTEILTDIWTTTQQLLYHCFANQPSPSCQQNVSFAREGGEGGGGGGKEDTIG